MTQRDSSWQALERDVNLLGNIQDHLKLPSSEAQRENSLINPQWRWTIIAHHR